MSAEKQKNIKVMVMAGGTGGHIFPALAVARELQSRGAEIMWLGTHRGMESDIIPKQGIPIVFINIAGLRGNGMLGWLLAPMRIVFAVSQVIKAMRKFQPSVVIGFGGFVTGPGGIAAWLLGIPLVIHEQNAIAGLTNKLLVPFTVRVLEAFPNTFSGKKVLHTGNPVRQDIVNNIAKTGKKSSQDSINLLVVGGSLGAKILNEVVPATISQIGSSYKCNIWHQTGKKLYEDTQKIYSELGLAARVAPFIDDMAEAYRWADIVVCRSGALTIAELAAAGVASILVPYPFAVDDHQTANAKYLSDAGAAIIIQQKNLNVDLLSSTLLEFGAERISAMGIAAKRLALPNATKIVADQCIEVVNS